MPPHLYYTLFMLLALAVFLFVRRLIPKPPALQALPWWTRTALALAGFIGGALGAKLPFVFGFSDEGWLSLWFRDGKTITTGLLGAYLGVELAKIASRSASRPATRLRCRLRSRSPSAAGAACATAAATANRRRFRGPSTSATVICAIRRRFTRASSTSRWPVC